MSTLLDMRRKFLARWRQFLRELDPMVAQLPMEELAPEIDQTFAKSAPVPERARTEPRRDPEPSPLAPSSKRTRARTLREDLLDRQTLRRAIVLREILDRPLALRARRGN